MASVPRSGTSPGRAPRHGHPGGNGQPETGVIGGVGGAGAGARPGTGWRSGYSGVDRPVHGAQFAQAFGGLLANRTAQLREPVSQALRERPGGVSGRLAGAPCPATSVC